MIYITLLIHTAINGGALLMKVLVILLGYKLLLGWKPKNPKKPSTWRAFLLPHFLWSTHAQRLPCPKIIPIWVGQKNDPSRHCAIRYSEPKQSHSTCVTVSRASCHASIVMNLIQNPENIKSKTQNLNLLYFSFLLITLTHFNLLTANLPCPKTSLHE